jgi:toxin ParE1/3/4
MIVHWTETAERHLDAIFRYISQDSAEYAVRTVDRVTRRSMQVSQFPRSGRKVPEFDRDDVREVVEGPYRLIYRIQPKQIDVIAVLHGARDLRRAAEEEGWDQQDKA